jgi:hypothetical protein
MDAFLLTEFHEKYCVWLFMWQSLKKKKIMDVSFPHGVCERYYVF